MTLKHVIVERMKPGMEDRLEDLAMELRAHMDERGWLPYKAWRWSADVDLGEPPLFDVGILNRATPGERMAVFEGEFPDRETFERQLAEMRSDPQVVKILIKASELSERSASRSYVLESWEPDPR